MIKHCQSWHLEPLVYVVMKCSTWNTDNVNAVNTIVVSIKGVPFQTTWRVGFIN